MFLSKKNISLPISCVLALLFFANQLSAQYPDSLWKVYGTISEPDTQRLKAIKTLTQQYLRTNPDSALIVGKMGLALAKELNNKKGQCDAYSYLGTGYYYTGNYPASIKSHTDALKLAEEHGFKGAIASAHNNIGIIYFEQKSYEKALREFNASLNAYKALKDSVHIASISSNIGNVYCSMKKYAESIGTNKEALYLLQQSKAAPYIIANTVNNIGVAYQGLKNYPEALHYFTDALKIREENKDELGIEVSCINLASLCGVQNNYKEGEKYADKALALATQLNDLEGIKETQQILSEVYSHTNRPEKALQSYKAYIAAKDSLINEENSKQIMQTQMQYEFEKKEALLKVEQGKRDALVAADGKRQKIILLFVSGILVLSTLFAIVSYRRFKLTKRQKQIIEIKEQETQEQNKIISQQKHLVEEKHKEITDSINYAERIQRSFLATKELLDANLKEYFVFFKPKDVVSGDFYWAGKLGNGYFALVTADSTGHGVPGAIMSLLNITSIESAIKDGNKEPAAILNETRRTIIDRLKKDGSEEGGKDGMDCSLCIYDFAHGKLHIGAANNPVWIVRDNEAIEIKPDKMPVGKHDKQDTPFSQQAFDLQKGDVIYTLTDGFPDQFGGMNGKKFMSKRLRHLLTANAHRPMHEQRELLERELREWAGNLEQVDDICIIGIRV